MIIKLKISVNPDYYNKKAITVKAWKARGKYLAIHKRCDGDGYNISQIQVGLYIPPTLDSLCKAFSRYKKLTTKENWRIPKPVFGKHLVAKKYNHLKSLSL